MENRGRIFILAGCIATVCLFLSVIHLVQHDDPSRSSVQVQKYFNGTQHEVTAYMITGELKGPTVLIFAGIHGDESGGYLTAERYKYVRVKKGTLIVVPRLNLPAILKGTRQGIHGDMNRLFHIPENSGSSADSRVVDLAKSLIKQADFVVNLHQGEGFYSPKWISYKRNPLKWGQCNVIDVPIFDLPNGNKLDLAYLANKIAASSNSRIANKHYHFQVNNTNTASRVSSHKEQRKSLTYYALYKQHKMTLAIESTKNCSLTEAVTFLTIATNSVIKTVGIQTETLPSEDPHIIKREIIASRT